MKRQLWGELREPAPPAKRLGVPEPLQTSSIQQPAILSLLQKADSILSEVHTQTPATPLSQDWYESKFQFDSNWPIFSIKHRLATTKEEVGSQVWRSSLLLAEFFLHLQSEIFSTELTPAQRLAFSPASLRRSVCLELGSGTGLLALVLSRLVRQLVVSDFKEELLDLARGNFSRNQSKQTLPTTSKNEQIKAPGNQPTTTEANQEPLLPLATDPAKSNPQNEPESLSFAKLSLTELEAWPWHLPPLAHCNLFVAGDIFYELSVAKAFLDLVIRAASPQASFIFTIDRRLSVSVSSSELEFLAQNPSLTFQEPVYDHFMAWRADLNLLHPTLEIAPVPLASLPSLLPYRRRDLEIWTVCSQAQPENKLTNK